MKKFFLGVTILALLFVGFFFHVTEFSGEKIIVNFSGIEGFPVVAEVINPPRYSCFVEASSLIRNGDELALYCRNHYFSFIHERKAVTVRGLYQSKLLEFRHFKSQLKELSADMADPSVVFVKQNQDIDNTYEFGTSYFLFYNRGTNSRYYQFDSLLVKEGDAFYSQAKIETDQSHLIHPVLQPNDLAMQVNSIHFDDFYKKLVAFGYQKVN